MIVKGSLYSWKAGWVILETICMTDGIVFEKSGPVCHSYNLYGTQIFLYRWHLFYIYIYCMTWFWTFKYYLEMSMISSTFTLPC